MTLSEPAAEDLPTPNGLMRTFFFRPQQPGRYPGLLLFSEIFQVTAPIRRLAAALAGHGYLVAVPEVYHEFLPANTVLAYDQAGADQGNTLKYAKTLAGYDADVHALVAAVSARPDCTGALGSFGVCLGGHLALRAALHPGIRAAVGFYPTDLHSATLGEGKRDDTLQRLGQTDAELLLVFGRQDPHVPREGRRLIYERLADTERSFEWHEFNAAHAFLRDEGPRYDPALARLGFGLTKEFFGRTLGVAGM